jgi:uncharacterized repeat protein (TIGR02543 family)
MKIFYTFLIVLISMQVAGQSVTTTYSGTVESDKRFPLEASSSACPGILQVTIPIGAYVIGVDVEYIMHARNEGWKSDQVSHLRCVSPGGKAEEEYTYGTGETEGTMKYDRTGLDIADDVVGGGVIRFELHAGRYWPKQKKDCSDFYNYVVAGTWKVTVHYQMTPPIKHTLTVEQPSGSGSTRPAPGVYNVIKHRQLCVEGEECKVSQVNLKAEAAAGWQFVSWMGDVANPASAHTSVVMDGNKTVKANFNDLGLPSVNIPWYEPFTGVLEGQIPSGWTSNTSQWGVKNSSQAGGAIPELTFDRKIIATTAFKAFSPKLYSEKTTRKTVSFRHRLVYLSRGAVLRLQSSQDGFTWKNEWAQQLDGNIAATTVEVDISHLEEGNFFLTWVVDGYSYGVTSWHIDNIRIKAAPVLNLSATNIFIGQTVSASSLAASTASINGVDVAGTFAFVNPTQVFASSGTYLVDVNFTAADQVQYFNTTGKVSVTVDNAEIRTFPVASPITFGQSLAESVLSGGEANVSGSFDFAESDRSSIFPPAGVYLADVVFTADGTGETVSFKVVVDVAKAPSVVTWPTSASQITYGQTLSESVFVGGSATSSGEVISGTFSWNKPDSIPSAGSRIFNITFTPDSNNFETIVNGEMQLTVNKKVLIIKADNKSKIYDGKNYSTFSVTYDEFIFGEDESFLNGSLSFSGTAYGAVNAKDDYIIIPGGFTSDNYDITYVSGILEIIPASLTVTADPKEKVYDGKVFTDFTVTITGLAEGETAAALGGTITYGGTAITAKDVFDNYTIIPSGYTSPNYNITFQNGVLEITKAELVVKADNQSKVYDGKIFTGFTVTITGLAEGETAANLTGTITYGGTAVTAKDVFDNYTIIPSGYTSPNYNITFQNGTLEITKAELVVKADNKSKVYDGKVFTGFTVSFTGFAEGQTAASLGGTLAFSGTAITAVDVNNNYTIVPAGYTSNNYNITYQNGIMEITKADLTVKADNKIKVYDGKTFSGFTVTITGLAEGQTAANLTGALTFSGTAITAVDVNNNYTIVPAGYTSNNYNITYQNGIMEITKADLTVKADNKTKIYDGLPFTAFTVTYTGFVDGESVADLTGSLDFNGSAIGAVNVGENYEIIPTGFSSGNYAITFVTGYLNITTGTLTIKAEPKIKVYDGKPYTDFTVTYAGFADGDGIEDLEGSLTFMGSAVDAVVVGDNYEIIPSGFTSEKYNIQYESGFLSISPASLLVKAENKTKLYDGEIFKGDYTVSYTGFAEGETAANLNGILEFSGTAMTAVNAADNYTIIPAGYTSQNYNINFQNGKLEITKADLTVVADNKTKVYDGETYKGFSVTISGFVNDETAASLDGSPAFSGTAITAVNAAGNYTIIPAGYTSGNYNITYQNGILNITKADLVVKADNQNKVYDGKTFTGFTVSFSGFVNDETADNLEGSLTFSGTAIEAVNAAGNYTIIPAGYSSENYNITFQNGILEITKADLTVVADNKTKGYDGKTFSGFTVSFSGFVNDETADNLDGNLTFSGTAVEAVNAAGNYTIIPAGYTSGNYNITFQNGILEITKASVTVKADNQNKVYDGMSFSGFTVTLTGLAEGETAANLDGTLAFNGSATEAVNAGEYVITPSGFTSINYTISYENGQLVIEKAEPVVTLWPVASSVVYGEALSASLLTGGEVAGVGNDALTGTFSFENADFQPVAGTHAFSLKFTPADGVNYKEVVSKAADYVQVQVEKYEAQITLDKLYQAYNGNPLSAGVTFDPEKDLVSGEVIDWNFGVIYTGIEGTVYESSALAPVLPGLYEVVVTVDMDNYQGSKTAQMQIDQGAPEVTWPVVDGKLIYGDKAEKIALSGGKAIYPDWHAKAGEDVEGEFIISNPSAMPPAGLLMLEISFMPVDAGLSAPKTELEVVVDKKELTIGGSFTAEDKIHDGTVAATADFTSLTLVGVVEGDEEKVRLENLKAEFAAADIAEDVDVIITAAELTGEAAENYTLTLEGAPVAKAHIKQIPVYLLTLTANPVAAGSVKGYGEYREGEKITIAAEVNTGYIFVEWTNDENDVISTEATFEFTMPAKAVTLTANYVKDDTSTDQLTRIKLRVYPNPARDELNIDADRNILKVRMFDINGRLFLEQSVDFTGVKLQVNELPVGVYLLHIQTSDGIKTQRVQIAR